MSTTKKDPLSTNLKLSHPLLQVIDNTLWAVFDSLHSFTKC